MIRVVEFIGGPNDGERRWVEGVEWRVMLPSGPMRAFDVAPLPDSTVPYRVGVYRLAADGKVMHWQGES